MNDNIMGMLTLQPLLANKPYLPFTNTSLKPCAMAHILNDIIINERQNILELGSGLSTILMARFAEKSRWEIKITSVDHDAQWITKVRNMLYREGLPAMVNFIHAPLTTKKRYALQDYMWYDEETLGSAIDKIKEGFDLVIVDGPPAYNKDIEYSRMFAFPFLQKYLATSYAVMIDDVNRQGESAALAEWSKLLGPCKKYHDQLGVITKGNSYDVSSL